MKSLKTKKNTQILEKKKNKQLNKLNKRNGKTFKPIKNMNKHSLKKSIKYNKKGGGEYQLDDQFSQDYESVEGDSKESFEGALRGLGDGLKIEQPIGQGDGRQPMPEMPDCCIL
jgi:hypothetical protein